MDYTIENVEKLIYELYHNVSNQAVANEYLTLAQVSPAAWNFSWALLSPNKPLEVQYFGASTLHVKISKCWHELDAQQQVALKERLVEVICSYLTVDGTRIVQTRLVVALAAYVVHSVTIHWGNAIPELMNNLQPANLSHVPPVKLVQILTDLLAIIPEEFQSTHMSQNHRGITRSALLSCVNQIFNYVFSVLSQQDMPIETHQSAIKCFSNWTQHTGPLILGDNHEEILTYALQAIANDDLCQTAVDAICSIYSHPEIHKYPNSVLNLIDKMVFLESVLNRAIQENNHDVCSQIYNLFIQVGENHSRLLLDAIVDKLEHRDNILRLITVVLRCSSTPGHYPVDETCSELTFSFWYTLQDDIVASDSPKIEIYLTLFNPLFQSLMDAFLVKVQYPADEIYECEWNAEEKESFRCYRQDIGDSFMYCYNVTRASMFSSLLSHFSIAVDQLSARISTAPNKSWQYLEAVLYTLGSIAENVDIEEEQYLPKIFNLLPDIPFTHVNSPKLLATTMDVVGAYSEWISNHGEVLPKVISLLLLGLKSHQTVTVSATMAFKDISRECQLVIKPFAEQILSSCVTLLRPDSHLRPKERARLMCTVGQVLSVLPVDAIMTFLNELLPPILAQLQDCANSANQSDSTVIPALREYTGTQLSMLAMLFSTLDINLRQIEVEEGDEVKLKPRVQPSSPQPIFPVIQQVLPVLINIGLKWSSDEAITEALCDCIKKAVITLLDEIKPLVNDILQLLVHLYRNSPQASILDISKQLILLFGWDPDLKGQLMDFYVQLCSQTMLVCQSDLRQQTYLIEMFFSMSTQILKKVPAFYEYQLLDVATLFRCASSALLLPEKPTVRAVSSFLSEFINHSRENENMVKVVNSEGENLLGHVFVVIGGTQDSPRGVVEHTTEILMSFNQKYFDNLCRWMNVYVQRDSFPTPRATRDQKEHFVRFVLKERKNKRRLKEHVNEFSLICRGLIGTDYGNQPIKLPF